MRGIIIYQTNYGSTEQYARWITEETGFRNVELKKVRKQDLRESDTIILGSPIFAGRPLNAKWIEKKWPLLKDKKVILYTTSGAKGDDPLLKKSFESTFSEEMRERMAYFPQGGRMIHSELKPLHRFFMNLGKKMEKDPLIREEMDRDKDHVNRQGITPLLEFIK